METTEIKKIIEALLFVSDQPLNVPVIRYILGELAREQDIEQLVNELTEEYQQRNSPMEIRFIAGGWQFSTKKEYSPFIRKLYKEKTTFKLSNSALETMAVIAYKQPITRSEIEEIRGVEAGGVIDTLLERKLIRIVGRKETLGRPLLYGTTNEFLKHFGLSHLSELPSLEELTPQDEAAPEEPILDTPEQTDASVAENSAEHALQQEEANAPVSEETPLEELVVQEPVEAAIVAEAVTEQSSFNKEEEVSAETQLS
jgi:segregation and condensation protein B